jgi:hypothetical protein
LAQIKAPVSEVEAVRGSAPVRVTISMPQEAPLTSRVVGQLRASVAGTWAVEVATDLVQWKELRRIEVAAPGLMEVFDAKAAGSGVKFYRLRQVSGL